ncbi:pyrroline-5-carboxylate reductase [Geobacillus sp. 46C-IIa]|uniref:pyrroline-5-carboxylate reductase ProI n=1 Tax=Geobacillus sp. 46C-IIa TaxID=1963025 RepID=UPI0009BF9E8C|nr:pyrroline-5-carboxylate reductase ProI [Geobacillus sp. 46C-IIa]OQP06039.1 pyrroline-5-carboxylate reductase [Geobacillus sp. 46C-IIa]QNU28947.1 pyrroline-5-carboxylate reductase [Geobacillus sp. 46C-IIa]
MTTARSIAFIGAGSMAEALIAGMTKTFCHPAQIVVTNRQNRARLEELERTYGIRAAQDARHAVEQADIIILAMKPKDVAEAMATIAPAIRPNQLMLSLLAGVTTETIERLAGRDIAVVRAMPNTSAAVGLSATAIAGGRFASKQHLETAKQLFETVGIVTVVPERDLHAVTGLSGSGPAYVYYLVEAMEKAAADIGLERDVAKTLILQTIIGAAEMLKASDKHPSVLRREVTSPGGTTEAGISVLEQYRFQEAIAACIRRATVRSEELGSALLAAIAES